MPQARQKIVDTAEENGIAWNECKAWLQSQKGPWNGRDVGDDDDGSGENDALRSDTLNVPVPDYYCRAFHAYADGNLCWEAALEVEIAAAAVGARNFPAYGADGEQAFRDAFGTALRVK